VERAFDLNIERVLEDWTVVHALREVIANALDEAALTSTDSPAIDHDHDGWHVQDQGRGLRVEHLTQNEDAQKLANPDRVIGKFGVGLKDALATFDRHGVQVVIRSRHADMTVAKAEKHGFEELERCTSSCPIPAIRNVPAPTSCYRERRSPTRP
jgi:DNA gyrase/topoisomerase IV subunit B